MVEQGRKPQGAGLGVAQDLEVRAVPISVQHQVVNRDRLPRLLAPAHPHAELEGTFVAFALVVGIESDLAFPRLLEILARVEPGVVRLSAHENICVYELVADVLHPEHLEQAVDDDLVDALVSDDAIDDVVIRKLVVDLALAHVIV